MKIKPKLNKKSEWEIIPDDILMSKNGSKIQDQDGYLIENLNNFTPKKVIKGDNQGTNITTENMAFPIMANGKYLEPNTGEFYFPQSQVEEIPMMQSGGRKPIIGTLKQYQAYQDSLNLYNKYLPEKNKYLKFVKTHGFDPFYIKEWKTNGYVDTDIHKKIGATSYGILQNAGGGFDRNSDNIPRDFTIYPRLGGEGKEVYDDSDEGKILKKRYPVYQKPVQPIIIGRDKETSYTLPPLENNIKSQEINQNINQIPYAKGTYFTRNPQQQEIGKTEYFDSKTGKSLNKFQSGGRITPSLDDRAVARARGLHPTGTTLSRVLMSKSGKPIGDIELVSGWGRNQEQIDTLLTNQTLISENPQNLNFNPIPYRAGSYFSREPQQQEIGKKEYFDSKTGRPLNKFQDGGYQWSKNNQQEPRFSVKGVSKEDYQPYSETIDPETFLKAGLDVYSAFNYPASVLASAHDFYKGENLSGALGLIPVVGKNTPMLKNFSRNMYTNMINAGVKHNIAQPIKKVVKNVVPITTKTGNIFGHTTDVDSYTPKKQNGGSLNWEIIED